MSELSAIERLNAYHKAEKIKNGIAYLAKPPPIPEPITMEPENWQFNAAVERTHLLFKLFKD